VTAIPVADWRAEVTRRGGGDWKACRFKCLSCGLIFTPAEYEAVGGNPRFAMQECLGRAPQIKAKQHVDGNTKPCNWATYGMFQLGGLTEIQIENGSTTSVWPFADEDITWL
jgi:hypothetical protein